MFLHRLRGAEGKDGTPMNEVRLLAASLLTNGGRLVADTQIKLRPESSVLGYSVGDEIRLDRTSFTRLSNAYLDEIAVTFV